MKTFKVFRYTPDQGDRWQEYTLETKPDDSVLECLHNIRAQQDPTLAYRFSCRSAVCGSCAISVNGRPRLACQTRVSELKEKVVVLAPLPGLKVFKDLIVDMKPFWEAHRRILPWLVEKPGADKLEITNKVSDIVDKLCACILCAACYASCPEAGEGHGYLGPMPLMEGYRLLIDPRDDISQEREKVLGGNDGVWGCHGAFACLKACPWDLGPVEVISEMRVKFTRRRFGLSRVSKFGQQTGVLSNGKQ